MRSIELLRNNIPTELFSSIEAEHILGHGAQNRLCRLVESHELNRIKNGIYTFSQKNQKKSLNNYLLANTIYGPSYVSLESALEYYSMIPERVFNVTSITPKRTKNFNTPLGSFIYRKIPIESFSVGIKSNTSANGTFLIASKEKAITDKLYLDLPRSVDAFKYLVESLRIEEEDILNLNHELLIQLSEKYNSKKLATEIHTLIERTKT